MTRRVRGLLAAVFVVLVAVVVRLWGLAEVGLWHDEAISHFYASNSPGWILRHCAGFINHPPLFFLLLHGWLSVVPAFDQWSVELMNVLFGSLTAAVLFRWADLVLDRTMAFVLGIVLSLNAFHVYYSGEVRMYALATLGLTVSALFASRLLRSSSPDIVDWVGWVLGCLVSVYSHSFTALPVTFMVLYVVIKMYQRGLIREVLTATAVIVGVYTPWGIFALRQARDIASGYWLPDFRSAYLADLVMLMGGFVGPWSADVYAWWMTAGVLIGFLCPLFLSLRWIDEDWVGLCWWMVVGPLLIVVGTSLWGQSVFLFRPYLVVLPIVVLLVGKGLQSFPKIVFITVIVVYGSVLVAETARLKANPPHQYAREVANWITEESNARDVVIHTDRFSFFPSYFYHKRRENEFLLGANPRRSFALDSGRARRLNENHSLFVVFPGEDSDRVPKNWLSRADWRGSREWSGRRYRAVRIPAGVLNSKPETSE
jgi:hypothetical protein